MWFTLLQWSGTNPVMSLKYAYSETIYYLLSFIMIWIKTHNSNYWSDIFTPSSLHTYSSKIFILHDIEKSVILLPRKIHYVDWSIMKLTWDMEIVKEKPKQQSVRSGEKGLFWFKRNRWSIHINCNIWILMDVKTKENIGSTDSIWKYKLNIWWCV